MRNGFAQPALVLFLLTAVAAHAQERAPLRWRSLVPDSVFVQYGGGTRTETATLGLQWHLPWHTPWLGGGLSAYVEASIGRWSLESDPRTSSWVTQLGITPTLRWRPDHGDSPWFAEAGIGANIVAPIYRNENRRFSTTFNFGDHLGVGRNFGEKRTQEIALRYEHFSNAGISHPNPGMNFAQLRYTVSF